MQRCFGTGACFTTIFQSPRDTRSTKDSRCRLACPSLLGSDRDLCRSIKQESIDADDNPSIFLTPYTRKTRSQSFPMSTLDYSTYIARCDATAKATGCINCATLRSFDASAPRICHRIVCSSQFFFLSIMRSSITRSTSLS